jgi:plasmid stabilization system protein ParE
MQQIAVAAVQLDHVVADAIDALGRRGEFADAALDVVFGHGVRHRPAGVIGDGRRRLGSPAAFFFGQDRLAARRRRRGRTLASGVRKLHAEFGDAIGTAEIVHALERRLVIVGPHAGAFRRNPPDRIDVGHLAHHEPRAAEREAAEMHQVPIGCRPIVGIVLAHRRDDDPIGKSEPAQRDGRKQDASHFIRYYVLFFILCSP